MLSREEKELRKETRRQKKFEESHKIIKDIDHKLCNRCNIFYPATIEFYYHIKNKIDGLYPYCKKCAKTKSLDWHWNNREEYVVRKRKYNKLKRKTSEEWRTFERNHSKQQSLNGYFLQWQRSNPEKMKLYGQKRQYKKHLITPREWDDCRQYFNFKCAYCGKTWEQNKLETKKDLHRDHVVHDGRNDLKNCVPSCASCNTSKGELSLNNWYNKYSAIYSYERYYKIYLWIRYDVSRFIKQKSQ